MKERGHYWKHMGDSKDMANVDFTFDLFLQALHIIATYGFEKLKDDLSNRINMLCKHIHEIMSSQELATDTMHTSKSTKNKSKSPGGVSKQNAVFNEFQSRSRHVKKDGSDIYLLSNRSGASTKSSRAKKHSSHSRKSRKRRSSQKKRGRRYGDDRNTPLNSSLLSNNPFYGKRGTESSLPALSAIYGTSLENHKRHSRRNNSNLAALDMYAGK